MHWKVLEGWYCYKIQYVYRSIPCLHVRSHASSVSAPSLSKVETLECSNHIGEKSQMKITFSSYASQVQNVKCDAAPPVPAMTDDYKKSCEDALLYLPTSTKILSFNTTRTSRHIVPYILPRRCPDCESHS